MIDIWEYFYKHIEGNVLDIGHCKLYWENTDAYKWMMKIVFIDIWGKKLFPDFDEEKMIEGSYENEFVYLKKGDVVFDVGANIGIFSAYACAMGCKVYAFEPLSKNHSYLRQLKKLNPTFDLTIIECALSNSNGRIGLNNLGDDLGGGTIELDILKQNKARDKRRVIKTIVNTMTLDTFVQNQEITKIDFIKADIEGAEVLLVKGGTKTLKELKPQLSLCSYHRVVDPDNLEELILKANSSYNIIKGKNLIYGY